jgi:hypothetical protein
MRCGRIIVGVACLFAAPGNAAPPAPGHPIFGTWQLSLPGSRCVETYEYRSDGSAHTLSAAEETFIQYEISATPDPGGVYVLVNAIKKSNGQPDCSGHITPAGISVTLYLAPLRGGFLLCFDPGLQRCIGPMRRIGSPKAPPPAS